MTTPTATLPQRLHMKQVVARVGFNASTIGKWYRAGRFPKPHYIAGRRRWWLHEVEAWEAQNVTMESTKNPQRQE